MIFLITRDGGEFEILRLFPTKEKSIEVRDKIYPDHDIEVWADKDGEFKDTGERL